MSFRLSLLLVFLLTAFVFPRILFMALGFLLTIAIVITVHEFGHYLAARFFRVRILRFSIGFGDPVWKRMDKRGVEWRIAKIPAGAYVQMLSKEEAEQTKQSTAQVLDYRPPWQRFIVYGAGPLANFVLAVMIYTALHMVGETHIRPVVGEVRADSPAALAGFATDDEIAMVNNRSVKSWREVWARFVDSLVKEEAISVHTATGGERVIPAGALSLEDMNLGFYRGVGIARNFSYMTSGIKRVIPGSPADHAGVLAGDVVVTANDAFVDDFEGLLVQVAPNPNSPLTLVLWRDGEDLKTVAQLGVRENERGFLGVEPKVDLEKYRSWQFEVRYGFPDALLLAVVRMWEDVKRTFNFLRLVVTFQLSLENLSGPVGIADMAGKSLQAAIDGENFNIFLRFLALISVSLGAINLVPFVPEILDGYHMALCVIESVSKRTPPEKARALLQRIGLALIVGLMIFITINDILKLW